MNLKKARKIYLGLGLTGIALIWVGALLAGVSRLAGILVILLGLLVVAAAIVFHSVKMRCSHCGEWIRGSKYCPHCGQHLVDLE